MPVIEPHVPAPPLDEAAAQSYPVGEVDDALKNIPSVLVPTLDKVFDADQKEICPVVPVMFGAEIFPVKFAPPAETKPLLSTEKIFDPDEF